MTSLELGVWQSAFAMASIRMGSCKPEDQAEVGALCFRHANEALARLRAGIASGVECMPVAEGMVASPVPLSIAEFEVDERVHHYNRDNPRGGIKTVGVVKERSWDGVRWMYGVEWGEQTFAREAHPAESLRKIGSAS